MSEKNDFNSHPLVRKLNAICELGDDDKKVLATIPSTIRDIRPDQDIVREGDRPSQCCLLLEGLAYRYKVTPLGRRQIFSFHIPGDIPDLQSLHLDVMDHSLGTLTQSKVAFIPHQAIFDILQTSPRLTYAFWRETLIDASIFREWMVGLGRRSAYQRIAHLLCEMFVRLKAIGHTDGFAFELPLTQEELGDSLGLTSVHVNRVLQELRSDGLVALKSRSVTAKDWEGLKQAGEFDSAYLHLREKIL